MAWRGVAYRTADRRADGSVHPCPPRPPRGRVLPDGNGRRTNQRERSRQSATPRTSPRGNRTAPRLRAGRWARRCAPACPAPPGSRQGTNRPPSRSRRESHTRSVLRQQRQSSEERPFRRIGIADRKQVVRPECGSHYSQAARMNRPSQRKFLEQSQCQLFSGTFQSRIP